MRIIAGRYKGRVITLPKTRETRPMGEKVRGAVFDILGPLDGMSVLDAYAGSGALGFEALSRGAQQVEAIEMGREAIRAIRGGIVTLDLSFNYQLYEMKVETWMAQESNQTKRFDLIFAMPPYAILDRELISRLGSQLNPDGILVVEYPAKDTETEVPGLTKVAERSYGDPRIVFYRA